MNEKKEGGIHNLREWGNERKNREIMNGWEEAMCEYVGRCEKSKDPDYFFTRCSCAGEECQIRYSLEKE